MEKINIENKFKKIKGFWNPGIVGELNGQYIKLAKLKGEFVWHDHKGEDEMFFVIKGRLIMHFQDRSIEINQGEFLIVPKGVQHKPEAVGEVEIMLFEPKLTKHTGEVESAKTNNDQQWI